MLKAGGGTSFPLCLKSIYGLESLYHQGEGAAPLVKSEKEKLHKASRSKSSWQTLSLFTWVCWAQAPCFGDLLSTSPTKISTISIHLRPIQIGSYPMVEERANSCFHFDILTRSIKVIIEEQVGAIGDKTSVLWRSAFNTKAQVVTLHYSLMKSWFSSHITCLV